MAAPSATPEEVRETADEILSRSEYQPAEPSVADRVLGWISDRLGEILGAAVGSGRGYWIGYGILALAVVGAGYLLWRLYPRGGGLLARPPGEVGHQTVNRRSRGDWLARAGEAEASARWDEAVHARYHALTTGLADQDRLPVEESATSGEHRRAFARSGGGDPGSVEVFSRVTDTFERVWFGGTPAAPDDSRALAEADRRLVEDGP